MSLLLAAASGGTAYSLTCAAGSYSIAGQASTLGPGIIANAGAYAISGQAATLGAALNASAGAYTLSGQNALLGPGLNANAGSYAIAGQSAQFAQGHFISAASGIYNLLGIDAQLDSTSIPSAPPIGGSLPVRKKRRYYVDIDGQTYHGTLAQVQAYIIAKADADRDSDPSVPVISQQKLPQTLSYPLAQAIGSPLPSLLEYNTVAQLQQLYLDLLRNSVASAPQDAYNVALIQQQLAEQDDEEAIFALLH